MIIRGIANRGAILLAALLLAGSLRADEGRIPVFEQTEITEPGHYVLTRPLTVDEGPAIRIANSDVTLDLNEFTVTQLDAGSDVITIGSGRRNVAIRSGRVRGGRHGIHYASRSPTVVRIENIRAEGQANQGVWIDGAQSAVVQSCRVHNVGDEGIHVRGVFDGESFLPFEGRFVDNDVRGTGEAGIWGSGLYAGVVRGNRVFDFAGLGAIRVTGASDNPGGNLIEGNVVSGSGEGIGIQVFNVPGNRIAGNTVTNVSTGFRIQSDGNGVTGNVARGNAGDGFFVRGARNLVEANQSEANEGFGMSIDSSEHAARDNMARGNTEGEISIGAGSTDGGGNIE